MISVAVESTAQYHFKLVFEMVNNGIDILVANPQQTKTTQGKKTNKFDARRIAVAHRDSRLKPSLIPLVELFNLRKAVRYRYKIINEKTKIKQRVNQIFHQKDFKYKKLLNSRQGMELLRLASIRAVDDKILSAIKGIYSHLVKDEALIDKLKKFPDRLDEVESATFENDIIQLHFLSIIEKKQELTYYIIAKNNKKFRKQIGLLLTIPGVGTNTAVAIMAEIADVSYFPSPRKLVKWAGLAPKVYQSGHKKHITGKIHKGGNKYLRRAVVLACQNIYAKGKKTNPIKKYMLKIKERTDNYWKAICAGARKLLTIIWYMLKRSEYWGNFKIDSEMKEKLTEIFQHKIQLFKSKIRIYRKIMRRLNYSCDELLGGLNKMEVNQRTAFKILVNSV